MYYVGGGIKHCMDQPPMISFWFSGPGHLSSLCARRRHLTLTALVDLAVIAVVVHLTMFSLIYPALTTVITFVRRAMTAVLAFVRLTVTDRSGSPAVYAVITR